MVQCGSGAQPSDKHELHGVFQVLWLAADARQVGFSRLSAGGFNTLHRYHVTA